MSGYVGAGFEVAGQFNPPLFPVGNEDPGNGLVGAVATLMALLCRQRTGLGQYVENPQLNATMTHVAHIVRRSTARCSAPSGSTRCSSASPPSSGCTRRATVGCALWPAPTPNSSRWATLVPGLFDAPAAIDRESRIEHDDLLGDPTRAGPQGDSTDAWIAKLSAARCARRRAQGRAQRASFLRDPEQHRLGRVAEGRARPRTGKVREIDQLIRVSGAGDRAPSDRAGAGRAHRRDPARDRLHRRADRRACASAAPAR